MLDESNGWFIGTAYQYIQTVTHAKSPPFIYNSKLRGDQKALKGLSLKAKDTDTKTKTKTKSSNTTIASTATTATPTPTPTPTHTIKTFLEIVVPDAENPQWSGVVPINPSSLRLLECSSPSTLPLFNTLTNNSLTAIAWTVVWSDSDDGNKRRSGTARWISLLSNVIKVVEVDAETNEPIGEVEVPVDFNLRLLQCKHGGDLKQFEALVASGICDWSGEAAEEQEQEQEQEHPQEQPEFLYNNDPPVKTRHRNSININYNITSNTRETNLNILTEIYLAMRDCMQAMLSERERCSQQREVMIQTILKYSFGGDIEQGLQLLHELRGDRGEDNTEEVYEKIVNVSEQLKRIERTREEVFEPAQVNKMRLLEKIRKVQKEIEEF